MTPPDTSATASIRLGDCLIKEGFTTAEKVDEALKIQLKEEKQKRFSRDQILPPLNSLSKKQRRLLLQQPPLNNNIGLVCVQKGLITKKKLYPLLKAKKENESTGELLIRAGILTSEVMENILFEHLGADHFGKLAVQLNFLTPAELENARRPVQAPRTLGEILCDQNVINPADLDYVLRKYSKQLKFGEILVKQGILDQSRLLSVLQEQFHKDKPLGQLLVEKNIISTEQLYQALSTQHHLPFKKISHLNLDDAQRTALTSIIGARYAQKNHILPLAIEGRQMTVAIYNPENIRAADDLNNVYSHLAISSIFITEDNFHKLFEEIYQFSLLQNESPTTADARTVNLDALDIDLSAKMEDDKSKDKTDYGYTNAEAQEIVNYLIKYGIGHNASDIHIEQDRVKPRLRFRIDGILNTLQLKWLEDKLQDNINAVISRIKVVSKLDIAERRLPQDGVFRVNYFDPQKKEPVDLDFRVATCPGITGENVTIRILDPRKAKVDIEKLNHAPRVLTPLKSFLKSPAGMILISGPTGSGKTSTLYSALQYLYDPAIKIITAEDPIEYSFPGIMQSQINSKIDLSFARLLRSFLRLDPDVILVGEIRDAETARIGFDAAQTGHLLLSTVHTNDSAGAIPRLLDLGIDYNQMAASLMCVLAQRLLRRNCPACTAPYTPPEAEWTPLFPEYPEHLTFFQGHGCPACNFTGYAGRTLISEILVISPEIARALNRSASIREIKTIARENGMQTMLDDGMAKLETTTLNELIRVVPNDMLKEFQGRQKELLA